MVNISIPIQFFLLLTIGINVDVFSHDRGGRRTNVTVVTNSINRTEEHHWSSHPVVSINNTDYNNDTSRKPINEDVAVLEAFLRSQNYHCMVRSAMNEAVNIYVNVILPQSRNRNETYGVFLRYFNNVCQRSEDIKNKKHNAASYDDRNSTLQFIDDPDQIATYIARIVRGNLEAWFPNIKTYLYQNNLRTIDATNSCDSREHVSRPRKTVVLNLRIDKKFVDVPLNCSSLTAPAADFLIRGSLDKIVLSEYDTIRTSATLNLCALSEKEIYERRNVICDKTQWFEWNVTVGAFVSQAVPFTFHEIDDERCDLTDMQRNEILHSTRCFQSKSHFCDTLYPSHNLRAYLIERLAAELGLPCNTIQNFRNRFAVFKGETFRKLKYWYTND